MTYTFTFASTESEILCSLVNNNLNCMFLDVHASACRKIMHVDVDNHNIIKTKSMRVGWNKIIIRLAEVLTCVSAKSWASCSGETFRRIWGRRRSWQKGGKIEWLTPLEKRFNLFTLFPLIISRNSIKLSHMNSNEKVPEYMLYWNNFLLSDLTQKVSNGEKIQINKNKQDFPYY